MNKETKLIVIGDAIEDIYVIHKNYNILETNVFPGGALNTYNNVKEINSNNSINKNIYFVPKLNTLDKSLYKVLRLNNNPDLHLCSKENKTKFYSESKYIVQHQINSILDICDYKTIIIFSDYNKGTLNVPIYRYKGVNKIFLGIVDSKYRSLHSTLFDYADNYIWRCTGSEYNLDYAKKFNYTIWTDGPNPIKLLNKDQKIIKTFKVPSVPVVSTCGAGDTFTASLGSYIYKYPSMEISNIEKAISFSIQASLDVVTQPKTATTNIKL